MPEDEHGAQVPDPDTEAEVEAEAEAAAPVVADEVLLASAALAQRALLETTPPETVGSVIGHIAEDEHVLTLLFAADLAGYRGWHWSVTIARVEDAEPTVLETELMPGAQALLAPEWVPWSERLAEYRAAQQAAAEAAAAEDDADDYDDDVEDDGLDDDGLGDADGYDAESDDHDDDDHDDHSDDAYDGIDIDELDDHSTDADETDADGTAHDADRPNEGQAPAEA